jgi:hypothetical protein
LVAIVQALLTHCLSIASVWYASVWYARRTIRALSPARGRAGLASPRRLRHLDASRGSDVFKSLVPPQAVVVPAELLPHLGPETTGRRSRDVKDPRELGIIIGG